MEPLEQKIRKLSFNTGLIFGVIALVCSILTFYIITGMATSVWGFILIPLLFSIIIPIVLAVTFIVDIRKKIGGYWTFKQAATGIFIMFLSVYVIQAVGRDLIFAKFFEPNMVQKTQDATVKATTKMLEKSGAPQEQVDAKMAATQKQFDDQKNVTIGRVLSGIAITIIFVFVLALIFAAIFKKDPPLYATQGNEVS